MRYYKEAEFIKALGVEELPRVVFILINNKEHAFKVRVKEYVELHIKRYDHAFKNTYLIREIVINVFNIEDILYIPIKPYDLDKRYHNAWRNTLELLGVQEGKSSTVIFE